MYRRFWAFNDALDAYSVVRARLENNTHVPDYLIHSEALVGALSKPFCAITASSEIVSQTGLVDWREGYIIVTAKSSY